ncbi:hypothetical protein [Legionella sainthelensi]|uniref:hypothetical protein n=1 Tax=Legionella sainthelensi TaxID=28087 RepID=UPI0006883503|nr:hypothetical protein [Legionella sainthelensi]
MFHALALGKLPVYTEYLLQNFAETDQIEMDNTPFSLRLYLGIVPDGSCSFRRYYNIPHKLRPSPLNFIYRSLDGSVKQLDHRRIHFSFLDFDAY